jgi:hypothetical protein
MATLMVVGRRTNTDNFGLIEVVSTHSEAETIRNNAYWNGGGATICDYNTRNCELLDNIITERFLSQGDE